jgi:hypothetical protein
MDSGSSFVCIVLHFSVSHMVPHSPMLPHSWRKTGRQINAALTPSPFSRIWFYDEWSGKSSAVRRATLIRFSTLKTRAPAIRTSVRCSVSLFSCVSSLGSRPPEMTSMQRHPLGTYSSVLSQGSFPSVTGLGYRVGVGVVTGLGFCHRVGFATDGR